MIKSRNILIEKIKQQGLPFNMNNPRFIPLLTLEDFFTENIDLGSIGCNLINHPGLDIFFNILKEIRIKDNVIDVLVGIIEVEESDLTMWPFSDRIYIITTASKEMIYNWVKVLEPDDIYEENISKINSGIIIPNGYKCYCIWWD